MLIPQGMAYAMIAGLPPIYGLYASTLPLIVYALMGTSRQLAVGPVAMVSLLTATGVGTLAAIGSEDFILLAILLALMVGVIQFLLGFFKLGFLVSFLSHPVISGFTSAAALIIGLSQLKHLLGLDLERSHHVHEILSQAFAKIDQVDIPTLLIGAGAIVLILAVKKYLPALPGQLLAVIFGILVVLVTGVHAEGVKIVGEIPAGLPAFAVPAFGLDTLRSLLPIALAISLVSFMESIAVAKAIQARHKNYGLDPNQELKALGLSNIVGSFFQSFPITGGFSRTAVNDQAGAKTGLASIVSAILVVLTLLVLTPLFYYLPNAILAAVIMVAVSGLFDYREMVHLWKVNRSDALMLLATFFGTLLLGIEQGILLGVVLSLAMVIYRTSRPHMAELGRVPGTNFYRNTQRFSDLEVRNEILVVRFDAQLYFANLDFFKSGLEEMIASKGDKLLVCIIDAESINSMDSSALHVIADLIEDLRSLGIYLYFAGVKGPVRDSMTLAGLIEKAGEHRFFMSVQSAVDYVDAHLSNVSEPSSYADYTLQSNNSKEEYVDKR